MWNTAKEQESTDSQPVDPRFAKDQFQHFREVFIGFETAFAANRVTPEGLNVSIFEHGRVAEWQTQRT